MVRIEPLTFLQAVADTCLPCASSCSLSVLFVFPSGSISNTHMLESEALFHAFFHVGACHAFAPLLSRSDFLNKSRRMPRFSSSIELRHGRRRFEARAKTMFVLGLGFVGQHFAAELKTRHHGWEVFGTCKSEIKKRKLEEMGFEAVFFDSNDPEFTAPKSLRDATHLLISIPPIPGIGDPVLGPNQNLLRSNLGNGNIEWMCYLSSTSVYGDCAGGLVDEDFPISATSERTKARVAAEKAWMDLGHKLGVQINVFRLGGIYGPGRSAVDTIVKQESLSKYQKMRESRLYTARIHVADICQALMASIDIPSSGGIYNIVDDDPAPRAEVFAFARALIEERWPGRIKQSPTTDNEDSVSWKENMRYEKRVSNARLKKELGVMLHYPTYRSGLQSIIESMNNPFNSSLDAATLL